MQPFNNVPIPIFKFSNYRIFKSPPYLKISFKTAANLTPPFINC